MHMANVRYISSTDTAKLIRAALKKRFPRTKFSVRTDKYSGGASIQVRWIDGPTPAAVEQITAPFAGSGFDGMIDMAYSKYAWLLPDGTATFAKTRGTAGSAGSVDSEQYLQPSFKCELVHFGANYVFTQRDYSVGFYQRAADAVSRRYGEPIAVKVSSYGTPHVDGSQQVAGQWASDLVYRELSRRMVAEA